MFTLLIQEVLTPGNKSCEYVKHIVTTVLSPSHWINTMAPTNNKCIVLFVLVVLASGEFCVVSGYRPFSFAFQNRHFPHDPKSSSSSAQQLPAASVTPSSLIRKQTYDLPSVETRNLLDSGSSSTIQVSPSKYVAASTTEGPQRVTKPTISDCEYQTSLSFNLVLWWCQQNLNYAH